MHLENKLLHKTILALALLSLLAASILFITGTSDLRSPDEYYRFLTGLLVEGKEVISGWLMPCEYTAT